MKCTTTIFSFGYLIDKSAMVGFFDFRLLLLLAWILRCREFFENDVLPPPPPHHYAAITVKKKRITIEILCTHLSALRNIRAKKKVITQTNFTATENILQNKSLIAGGVQ